MYKIIKPVNKLDQLYSLTKKSHKKDRKLHCIESKERTEKLQNTTQRRNNLQMICRIVNEDLLEKGAVYHASSCLSTYLSETNIQAKEESKDKFLQCISRRLISLLLRFINI